MQHYYHKHVCKSTTLTSTPLGFAGHSAVKTPTAIAILLARVKPLRIRPTLKIILFGEASKFKIYSIASPNTKLSGEAASPNKHFLRTF